MGCQLRPCGAVPGGSARQGLCTCAWELQHPCSPPQDAGRGARSDGRSGGARGKERDGETKGAKKGEMLRKELRSLWCSTALKNPRPSLSCRVISDPCNIKDSWTGSHQQPTRLTPLITTETDAQDVGQASTVLLQFSPNLSHRSSSPGQTWCFWGTHSTKLQGLLLKPREC